MSAYKPWKELERRHAKRMGGERLWRPDFGDSAPDGQTAHDVWDAKAYATFRVHTIFHECFTRYREWAGDRRFHLVLFSRKNKHVGDLVVLRADDYAADRKELIELRSMLDDFVKGFTSSKGTE